MADPIVIDCVGACTVTVVHELSIPPLQLSPAEASQIAAPILVLWAIAWGVRQVIRLIRETGPSDVSEKETQ